MKFVDTGKDKVQQICDVLKKETLEPAREEAQKIIEDAKGSAQRIIQEAKEQADRMHSNMKSEMEKEKNVFDASMNLACKQAISSLKQEIEQKLFNEQLASLLQKETSSPKLIAEIISALCKGIEKEGVDVDLLAIIPSTASAKDVAALIAGEVMKKIGEKGLSLGDFAGGAQVKIKDKNLIIDMSDKALRAFLAEYIREDLRELVFKASE